MESAEQAKELYHRLVLVVGPAGSGKTVALRGVQEHTAAPLINVNLELSRKLLDLSERQRISHLFDTITAIVRACQSDVVLLDNIELIFDNSLQQDPLRLLQGLSRLKTVVASWSGTIEGGQLVYATPDHPEYRRYPLGDFLVITAEPGD